MATFWIEEEAAIRGHLPQSEEGAESWLLGPVPLARCLRYLAHGVKSGGRPKLPSRRLRIDGRSVSRVFPHGFHEGVLYRDVEARIWSIGAELQGSRYRRARENTPGPALVLGASNVSSIAPTDLLSKLFCENRPVVCKIPTRLATLEPVFKEIFHPLIRDRHVQLLSGGPELGQALVQDPTFETVHLTGSKETYQKILEQNQFPDRTFTAELGCVTPVVIVPGPWSQKDLVYQARHLASLMTINGGYNCVTPQILVFSKGWSHKSAFLSALRAELKRFARRDDTFEGVQERRQSFRREHPKGEEFGPRTLVALEAEQPSRLFSEESFCGMLGWIELEADHPEEFMKKATDFCNHSLWGDLSCLVIVDGDTRRRYERSVAQMQTRLEYGTVALNVFPGLAFYSSTTPWGSYLDGRADTGNGWVHNNFFFDSPEKTVMEGPFIPLTPQPWVKPFPNLYRVGRALFELDIEPSGVSLAKFMRAYGGTLWRRFRRGGS